jgi:hypothetical protein
VHPRPTAANAPEQRRAHDKPGNETTVDLDKHRSASNLDELDLDESAAEEAA